MLEKLLERSRVTRMMETSTKYSVFDTKYYEVFENHLVA